MPIEIDGRITEPTSGFIVQRQLTAQGERLVSRLATAAELARSQPAVLAAKGPRSLGLRAKPEQMFAATEEWAALSPWLRSRPAAPRACGGGCVGSTTSPMGGVTASTPTHCAQAVVGDRTLSASEGCGCAKVFAPERSVGRPRIDSQQVAVSAAPSDARAEISFGSIRADQKSTSASSPLTHAGGQTSRGDDADHELLAVVARWRGLSVITCAWRNLGSPLAANGYLAQELVDHPGSPLAPLCWLWTGENFLRAGLWDAALKATLEVRARYTTKQPFSFFQAGMSQLAECYRALGRIDQAIETYRELIARSPADVPTSSCHYAIGQLYDVGGRDAEAIAAYRLAITAPAGSFNGERLGQDDVRDLARRAIQRLESGQPWLRPSAQQLQAEILAAIEQEDAQQLGRLACKCSFQTGGSFHSDYTEPPEPISQLLRRSAGRSLRVLPTSDTDGSTRRTVWCTWEPGSVLDAHAFVLTAVRGGWEWSALLWFDPRNQHERRAGDSLSVVRASAPRSPVGPSRSSGPRPDPGPPRPPPAGAANLGAVIGSTSVAPEPGTRRGPDGRVGIPTSDVESLVSRRTDYRALFRQISIDHRNAAKWRPRTGAAADEPNLAPGAILSPWPAGTRFYAGGMSMYVDAVVFGEGGTLLAATGTAAVLGGPLAPFTAIFGFVVGLIAVEEEENRLSQGPCGWGPLGPYYGEGGHRTHQYFAIDFNRFTPGDAVRFPGQSNAGFLTPVLSVADGIVVVAENEVVRNTWDRPDGVRGRFQNGGNSLGVFHPYLGDTGPTHEALRQAFYFVFDRQWKDYLPQYVSMYSHLDGPRSTRRTGIQVSSFMFMPVGMTLGHIDSTGDSSQPHLHFQFNDTTLSRSIGGGETVGALFADPVAVSLHGETAMPDGINEIVVGVARRPSPMDFREDGSPQPLGDDDGGRCLWSSNVQVDAGATVDYYGEPGSEQYALAQRLDLLRILTAIRDE